MSRSPLAVWIGQQGPPRYYDRAQVDELRSRLWQWTTRKLIRMYRQSPDALERILAADELRWRLSRPVEEEL